MPATLLLAVASLGISILISIPLGIHSALHKGWFFRPNYPDFFAGGTFVPQTSGLGSCFVLLFSITFPLLPASGFESWSALILPALTIGIILTATNVRLVRTQMLETLSAQYVMVARAKGMTEGVVIYKHALRNAAIAIVTFLGLQFGNLIGGLVVVELVFNWPGMGTLSVEAIAQRDYPLLQATVSILAIMIVAVNLAVDLVYGLIDPRIRVA